MAVYKLLFLATQPLGTHVDYEICINTYVRLVCVAAASSVSLKAKPSQAKLLPGSAPPTEVTAIDPHTRVPYIQRPPSQDELAAWKAAISGKVGMHHHG